MRGTPRRSCRLASPPRNTTGATARCRSRLRATATSRDGLRERHSGLEVGELERAGVLKMAFLFQTPQPAARPGEPAALADLAYAQPQRLAFRGVVVDYLAMTHEQHVERDLPLVIGLARNRVGQN